MLYFYDFETYCLYHELNSQLFYIIAPNEEYLSDEAIEDLIDKIILLYPDQKKHLKMFLPSITPFTPYLDSVINCLSNYRNENIDFFSCMEESNKLHEKEIKIIKEELTSSDLFNPNVDYFLNCTYTDDCTLAIDKINSVLSRHTWITVENRILKKFFEREIHITGRHQNKELLVPVKLGDKYIRHYITPKGLELIRTKFFTFLHYLYRKSFFACHSCLTYKSLAIYHKNYIPPEEIEYTTRPKLDELL